MNSFQCNAELKSNISIVLVNSPAVEISFTSDKHIGWVGLKARFGVDAQCVQALIFLVEVDKSQCGTFPRPVGVHPFWGLQRHSWWVKSTGLIVIMVNKKIKIYYTSISFFYLQFLYHTTSGWYLFTVGKMMTVQPKLSVSPSLPKATSNLSMMVVSKVTPCSAQKPSVQKKENLKTHVFKCNPCPWKHLIVS